MTDHPTVIADKAKEILEEGFGSIFKNYLRQPMLQVDPNKLPALGVFIGRERRSPDGDPNAGPIQFVVNLNLSISMSAEVSTDDAARLAWLEQKCEAVDNFLLTNPEFVALFEGIVSMERTPQYTKVGETALAEIRIEMVVQYRLIFAPVLTNDFKKLHIETRYPSADTDPEEVQQVSATIDIPQE